jgi:deoxyribonuclease V
MKKEHWAKVRPLHRWDLTPREAVQVQHELRKYVRPRGRSRTIRTIAAADVAFPSKHEAVAAFCVLSLPDFTVLDHFVCRKECAFPYVPGLLSFREIPVLFAAMAGVRTEPDVILCDGQGLAHPRGMGLATHLGVLLGKPTIGCAKSSLFGDYEKPGATRGDFSPITGKEGEVIGAVLTTRTGVKPLFVSVGNLVDLETAIRVVLDCCTKYRLPEPARLAHRLAGGQSLPSRGGGREGM